HREVDTAKVFEELLRGHLVLAALPPYLDRALLHRLQGELRLLSMAVEEELEQRGEPSGRRVFCVVFYCLRPRRVAWSGTRHYRASCSSRGEPGPSSATSGVLCCDCLEFFASVGITGMLSTIGASQSISSKMVCKSSVLRTLVSTSVWTPTTMSVNRSAAARPRTP